MRFSGFLAKAKSARVIVGGAVLALGLVGVGLANADAASPVRKPAMTKSGAHFTCLSPGCLAGGVGPVKVGDAVGPSRSDVGDPPSSPVPHTRWIEFRQRLVFIQCKGGDDPILGREYHGTVSDKNWAGQWKFSKEFLVGSTRFDDNRIPNC